MNGQDFLKVVHEAYAAAAEMGMNTPCVSPETFYQSLRVTYRDEALPAIQRPSPGAEDVTATRPGFPTPGMGDLSNTFSSMRPSSGHRYLTCGIFSPRIAIADKQRVGSAPSASTWTQHSYQFGSSFPVTDALQTQDLVNDGIPIDSLLAFSLPNVPQAFAYAGSSNVQQPCESPFAHPPMIGCCPLNALQHPISHRCHYTLARIRCLTLPLVQDPACCLQR